ncbi:hypothetical protein R6Q59_000463 [Mikania micrantha]
MITCKEKWLFRRETGWKWDLLIWGSSISLNGNCSMPLLEAIKKCCWSRNEKEEERNYGFFQIHNGAGDETLDASIFGDYPEEVKEHLGSALPSFTLYEKKFMKNIIDFIGINHYSTTYVKDCTNSSCLGIVQSEVLWRQLENVMAC